MTPGPDREEEEIYLQDERLIVSRFNALKSAQMADFPLAFVAQLNLSALSSLAGFDPLLPLSVFVDVTQGYTPFINLRVRPRPVGRGYKRGNCVMRNIF